MNDIDMHAIKSELESGEQLLWSGRPRQGVVFRTNDVFIIPFSLLWLGMAIFIFNQAGEFEGGFIFSHMIFLIIGLYFVLGRFIVDRFIRRKTYYGITNERVIIISEFLRKITKSIDLSTLSNINLTEFQYKRGTIYLGAYTLFDTMYEGMPSPGTGNGVPKLEMIDEAKSVYYILKNAKNALTVEPDLSVKY
ncbi:MAG: hypothetical protein KDI52_11985 [Xanthomonadales bacterium]|nr:hypothetical protein [Xanthomonadales bacterium]